MLVLVLEVMRFDSKGNRRDFFLRVALQVSDLSWLLITKPPYQFGKYTSFVVTEEPSSII